MHLCFIAWKKYIQSKSCLLLVLGLKLVLDAEHYDYGYFPRGARGFRVALSAATDQAIINQDGFYISPGMITKVNG
jgi:hypothetical protein